MANATKKKARKAVQDTTRCTNWTSSETSKYGLIRSMAREHGCSIVTMKPFVARALGDGKILPILDPEDQKVILGFETSRGRNKREQDQIKDKEPYRFMPKALVAV